MPATKAAQLKALEHAKGLLQAVGNALAPAHAKKHKKAAAVLAEIAELILSDVYSVEA